MLANCLGAGLPRWLAVGFESSREKENTAQFRESHCNGTMIHLYVVYRSIPDSIFVTSAVMPSKWSNSIVSVQRRCPNLPPSNANEMLGYNVQSADNAP